MGIKWWKLMYNLWYMYIYIIFSATIYLNALPFSVKKCDWTTFQQTPDCAAASQASGVDLTSLADSIVNRRFSTIDQLFTCE